MLGYWKERKARLRPGSFEEERWPRTCCLPVATLSRDVVNKLDVLSVPGPSDATAVAVVAAVVQLVEEELPVSARNGRRGY